jgi:hypothetical protein
VRVRACVCECVGVYQCVSERACVSIHGLHVRSGHARGQSKSRDRIRERERLYTPVCVFPVCLFPSPCLKNPSACRVNRLGMRRTYHIGCVSVYTCVCACVRVCMCVCPCARVSVFHCVYVSEHVSWIKKILKIRGREGQRESFSSTKKHDIRTCALHRLTLSPSRPGRTPGLVDLAPDMIRSW